MRKQESKLITDEKEVDSRFEFLGSFLCDIGSINEFNELIDDPSKLDALWKKYEEKINPQRQMTQQPRHKKEQPGSRTRIKPLHHALTLESLLTENDFDHAVIYAFSHEKNLKPVEISTAVSFLAINTIEGYLTPVACWRQTLINLCNRDSDNKEFQNIRARFEKPYASAIMKRVVQFLTYAQESNFLTSQPGLQLIKLFEKIVRYQLTPDPAYLNDDQKATLNKIRSYLPEKFAAFETSIEIKEPDASIKINAQKFIELGQFDEAILEIHKKFHSPQEFLQNDEIAFLYIQARTALTLEIISNHEGGFITFTLSTLKDLWMFERLKKDTSIALESEKSRKKLQHALLDYARKKIETNNWETLYKVFTYSFARKTLELDKEFYNELDQINQFANEIKQNYFYKELDQTNQLGNEIKQPGNDLPFFSTMPFSERPTDPKFLNDFNQSNEQKDDDMAALRECNLTAKDPEDNRMVAYAAAMQLVVIHAAKSGFIAPFLLWLQTRDIDQWKEPNCKQFANTRKDLVKAFTDMLDLHEMKVTDSLIEQAPNVTIANKLFDHAHMHLSDLKTSYPLFAINGDLMSDGAIENCRNEVKKLIEMKQYDNAVLAAQKLFKFQTGKSKPDTEGTWLRLRAYSLLLMELIQKVDCMTLFVLHLEEMNDFVKNDRAIPFVEGIFNLMDMLKASLINFIKNKFKNDIHKFKFFVRELQSLKYVMKVLGEPFFQKLADIERDMAKTFPQIEVRQTAPVALHTSLFQGGNINPFQREVNAALERASQRLGVSISHFDSASSSSSSSSSFSNIK